MVGGALVPGIAIPRGYAAAVVSDGDTNLSGCCCWVVIIMAASTACLGEGIGVVPATGVGYPSVPVPVGVGVSRLNLVARAAYSAFAASICRHQDWTSEAESAVT